MAWALWPEERSALTWTRHRVASGCSRKAGCRGIRSSRSSPAEAGSYEVRRGIQAESDADDPEAGVADLVALVEHDRQRGHVFDRRADARTAGVERTKRGMRLSSSIARSRTTGVSPQTNSSQSSGASSLPSAEAGMVLNAPATCTSAGRCARTNSVADPLRYVDDAWNAALERQRDDEIDDQCARPEVAAQTFEQFSEPVERHGEKHDIAPGRHFVVGDALDRKRRGGAVQRPTVARPAGSREPISTDRPAAPNRAAIPRPSCPVPPIMPICMGSSEDSGKK